MEIIAARTLNYAYVYLDIAWLVVYAAILIRQRRRMALLAGLIGGIVYFAVDYGIFYLLLGTRVIRGAQPAWFLLWLSMSYGLTNIAWIWLLLDRDGHAAEWSVLTIAGWVAVAFLSQQVGGPGQIMIQRGTASYHGVMALILTVGYVVLVLRNLAGTAGKANILWLLAIGIGVQLSWEAVLLISGIRPVGIMPLVVNALLETNLGMPYLYWIHGAATRRWGRAVARG